MSLPGGWVPTRRGDGRGMVMTERLAELWHDEVAATTVEMALLVALGALATFAAWRQLADTVENQAYESSAILEQSES